MKTFTFYTGYNKWEINAESPRNAVLKFRQQLNAYSWDIWFALPRENAFICIRDRYLEKDDTILYYDCEVTPIY